MRVSPQDRVMFHHQNLSQTMKSLRQTLPMHPRWEHLLIRPPSKTTCLVGVRLHSSKTTPVFQTISVQICIPPTSVWFVAVKRLATVRATFIAITKRSIRARNSGVRPSLSSTNLLLQTTQVQIVVAAFSARSQAVQLVAAVRVTLSATVIRNIGSQESRASSDARLKDVIATKTLSIEKISVTNICAIYTTSGLGESRTMRHKA